MHFSSYIAAIAATSSVLVSAAAENTTPASQQLRLIKTSEADPGRWVTEAEKLSKYVVKQRGFVDITDIKV